ncbi:transglutaminase family protein [soil metagenome]
MTATLLAPAPAQTAPAQVPESSATIPSTQNAAIPGAQPSSTAGSQAPAKTFDIDCELSYQLGGPTEFLFQIHAMNVMNQEILSESLEVTANVPIHMFEDPTVHHRFMRLHAEAGPFKVHYRARVLRTPQLVDTSAPEVPVAQLPDDVLHNLMPTRYCESDLLGRTAAKLFGAVPQGYGRVKAICDWIHANIDYQIGSTQATSTACDVYLQRAGVCRDFAHLGVTFCRALNIPARLVVGYARFNEPPPDFHAVFEAFIGNRWVLFDPTEMSPVDELVRIATGRDAKDVAFATIFGPAQMVAMNPMISEVRVGG